jgi:UDP-glucose 4-epimerase
VADTTLVTGGAGFIGSQLVRSLLRLGHAVVVYDNFTSSSHAALPASEGLVVVEGDIRDAQRLRGTVAQFRPNRVCHLAALHVIPFCERHPDETRAVNVDGTRAVLDACREHPPAVVVFSSSAAVYPLRGGRYGEDQPPEPSGVYAETKLAGERLVDGFCRETGSTTIIARLFNAYGPDDPNPHLIPEIVRQVSCSRTLRVGRIDRIRDYIHVVDLVAGLVMLLTTADLRGGTTAVFNLGSGEGRSVASVVESLRRVSGFRGAVVHEPGRMRPVDCPVLVADISRLTTATGWRPRVVFEDALRRMVQAQLRA